MVEINTYADGKVVPYKTINEWEAKRLTHATNFVRRQLGMKEPLGVQTMDEQRSRLAEMKIEMGEDKVRKMLGFYLGFSQFMIEIVSFLSFGRRKYSVVEVTVSDVDISPSAFYDKLIHIMMDDSVEYSRMRLMACPDHYLLANAGENTQEVIETTGGSPLPIQFYICNGDSEGLRSQKDSTYDVQFFGVARTKRGTPIGGVRHQIRQEVNGLRLKLLVEFPVLIPNWMIRQHQKHLMCEFGHWIRDVLAISQ
ncbi:hypothetical protein BGX21_004003 [Mortierella sp. AD011]|nr:hypothetical protein BGX20_002825 [Mortierella sp. AD010]KAF9400566.1 hypothetical protein BGX21_004003 [Mortierella sp. AD011]